MSAQVPEPRVGLRRFGAGAGYVVVGLIAAVFSLAYLGHGLLSSPTDLWRGNPGDPEQFMWFLAYIPRAILSGHNPLLTNYALYPAGANLMWNTSIVLPAIVMAPITLTLGPTVSFNVLLVAAPVATALTANLALRRWVHSRIAAGVGALAFAFCPFIIIHSAAGHLHLTLAALLPLIVIAADEVFIRQRWAPWIAGGLFGFLAACQLLTSEEDLLLLAFFLGVALIVACLLHRHEVAGRFPYAARASLWAAAVFIVLAAYPLYVQMLGPRIAPGAHARDVYVTDLANLVQPVLQFFGTDHGHNQDLPYTGNAAEWTGYLGVPLLIIIAIVVITRWRKRPEVPVATIAMVCLALLSLGPHLHVSGHNTGIIMPWWIFVHLPVVNNVITSRFSVAVSFLAAVLVAVFVEELLRMRRPAVRLAGAALIVLAALSFVPAGMRTTQVATPAYLTSSALGQDVPKGSVALVLPYIYGPDGQHPMLWQANAGMQYRMVDGWLIAPGDHAGDHTVLTAALKNLRTAPVTLTPTLRTQLLDELHRRSVQTVLVGPMNGRANALALFAGLFGSGPVHDTGGVAVWHVPSSN